MATKTARGGGRSRRATVVRDTTIGKTAERRSGGNAPAKMKAPATNRTPKKAGQKSPAQKSPARKSPAQLSKNDWLEAGLAMLGESGPGGVRLDLLCERVGMTKGSLYWHFADRKDLLKSLLDYWEMRETQSMIDELEATGAPPADRLWSLLKKALSKDYDFSAELSIRHWARNDRDVAKAVKGVDTKRINYIRDLLAECGFEGEQATTRAIMLYSVNLSQGSIVRQEAQSKRLHRLRESMDIILGSVGKE